MSTALPRHRGERSAALEAWDQAILDCFQEIRQTPTGDRTPCTLRLSRGCVDALDEALARLRPLGWSSGGDDTAWALRSAAIEVATRSHVGGARARSGLTTRRERSARRARRVQPALRLDDGELVTIVCTLPSRLLTELDELVPGRSPARARPATTEHLMAARSVLVESAVSAWLILRGYPTAAPRRRRRSVASLLKALRRE
ncbi:MAG: hypothetical protein GXY03_09600 [Solirubrobacterales bacterium]|nr:hypothetical protein [Solirubrobacterales bacterium]